jgi:hypothetical protein
MTTTSNGLTFAFWFLNNNSTCGTSIFNFGNGVSQDNIMVIICNDKLGFHVFLGSTEYSFNIPIPNINSWNHIIWTLSANNQWQIYINGNLSATKNNASYPNSLYRNNNYLGKNNNFYFDQTYKYFSGSLADFRIYNSILNQSEVTSVFTKSNKSPNSADIINSGISELYTPIFCNFMPSNNNFNTCTNCNFGSGLNINNQATTNGEAECRTNCKNNSMCTSYSYNLSNGNCRQYSDFPQQIFTGVSNVNSGYNLGFPFNYNNLDASQQLNIQQKCALQYTNNIFTPNKEINLGQCLSIQNGINYTNLNYDPECVYSSYKENGIPTNLINNPNYIANTELTQPLMDPILDNYKHKYDTYIQDRVQLSNINNVMSTLDPAYDSNYLNTVHNENNILGNEFLNSIKNEMLPLVNLTEKIPKKIDLINIPEIKSLESFENLNDSNNNLIKFIIFILIISIIFAIIYNICK